MTPAELVREARAAGAAHRRLLFTVGAGSQRRLTAQNIQHHLWATALRKLREAGHEQVAILLNEEYDARAKLAHLLDASYGRDEEIAALRARLTEIQQAIRVQLR